MMTLVISFPTWYIHTYWKMITGHVFNPVGYFKNGTGVHKCLQSKMTMQYLFPCNIRDNIILYHLQVMLTGLCGQ